MQSLDLSALDLNDPKGLGSTVERLYQDDYAEKRALALLWEEAIRFYEGDHWIRRSGVRWAGSWEKQTLSHPRLGPLSQPVSNHIFPAIRALVSAHVKNRPTATCTARRSDPSRVRARFAEKLDETLDELNGERENYLTAALWAMLTGHAFAKDFITRDDSIAGPVYVRDPQGQIMRGPDGAPLVQLAEDEQLTCASYMLSPFEFGMDPAATRLRDAAWCGEYSVRSIAWVREKYDRTDEGFYPENLKDLTPEVALTSTLNIWNRLRLTGGVWWESSADLSESVVVKEIYSRPDKRNPNGTHTVVANGLLLFAGPSEYTKAGKDLWHPYSEYRPQPFPGRFWCWGPTTQAVPLNRKINAIDAFIALVRATIMAPKLLIHKGHGIPFGHITGIPGQIIEHTSGSTPPQILQPGNLPGDIWKEREKAEDEIKYILGAFDPYSGQRAEGTPSYSAQAYLDEKAGDAHAGMFGQWEQFIEARTVKRLRICSTLIADQAPGLYTLVQNRLGVSNQELSVVKLGDLRDSVEMAVEAGSAPPRSRVLRQQAALDLVSKALIMLDNPEKQQKFLALYGMEDFASDSEEVQKAELENALILQGDASVLGMFLPMENQQLHVFSHTRSLVENFATMDDMAKQLSMQHLQMHQAMLQQQMLEQSQQAAAQGVEAEAQTGKMMPGSRGSQRPMSAVARGAQGNEPAAAA